MVVGCHPWVMVSGGVFISYRRDDSAGWTGRLYDRAVSALGSERVFMDVEAIAPGEDFAEAIEAILDQVETVLVVIGPRWLEVRDNAGRRRLEDPADYVRREIEGALVREIRVVPVLVGEAEMPSEHHLPENIRPLARRNSVSLRDVHFGADVGRLLDAIDSELSDTDAGETEGQSKPDAVDLGRSGYHQGQRLSTLPARYASFVGRQRELGELRSRLDSHRLVCLVGPGGIGKSSIARWVLRDYSKPLDAPVIWVPVDTLEGRDLVWNVATAMGLEPAGGTDPQSVIVGYAEGRRLLLLLDGCEPVVEQASELADSLLKWCPSLKIVATSREPLGLLGESVVRIDPLDVEEAFSLFCERADLRPDELEDEDVERINTICVALDGLPLAVELVAAQSRVSSLEHLADRLDDLIGLLTRSGHKDLRDSLTSALQGSYERLEAEEKRTLRYLSVLRHGFDIDTAEALLDFAEAADTLTRLVEVSLIQPPESTGRYRCLEPIRQFAYKRLEAEGEIEAAREAHARSFADRSREIFRTYATQIPAEVRHWIVDNMTEIASVIEWSLASEEPDIGIGILADIGHFLANSGYATVMKPLALEVVEHENATRSRDLAVALANTARMFMEERLEIASALVAHAEGIAREIEDPETTGRVLLRKAVLDWSSPKHTEIIEVGISLLRRAGAADWQNWYFNLALACIEAGDLERAEQLANHRRELDASGVGVGEGWTEILFGYLRAIRGDLDGAIKYLTLAASKEEDHDMPGHAQMTWAELAFYLSCADRLDEAREAQTRSEELAEITGIPSPLSLPMRLRLSSLSGQHEQVIERGRQWFRANSDLATSVDPNHPDRPVLRGGPTRPSDFLIVLLATSTSWLALGETAKACKFIGASQDLMAQTRFGAWREIGEAGRWQSLSDHCPAGQSNNMTLPQAFIEAQRALGL